jgi:UDP-glucose 4-epimerase
LSELELLSHDAFTDVNAVIHCAGVAHRMASEREYDQINVKGTALLAESAAMAGVRHFLFVSSLNVVPPFCADAAASPEALPEQDEPYARSKWLAESALKQICDQHDMALTVIRPALLFDHELTANLATLERILRWCPCLLPERGHRSLLSRSDLVELILACVEGKAGAPVGAVGDRCDRWSGATAPKPISRLLGPWKTIEDASPFSDANMVMQMGGPCAGLASGICSPGSTWRALSSDHWCGAPPEVVGWQPSQTLKTRRMEALANAGSRVDESRFCFRSLDV